MKISQRPIRTTIFFGLICGLSFIPLTLTLDVVISRSSVLCLTFWLFLVGYAFLLSHWSKKKFLSSMFPLMLLFLAIFLVESTTSFFFLALVVISWIRSGICFQKPARIRLTLEILLCFAGGILLTAFTPGSIISWSLGIWMLFLVQALYFVVFDVSAIAAEVQYEIDPFERASKLAEDILANRLHS